MLAISQFYESEEPFLEMKEHGKIGDIIGVGVQPGTSKMNEASNIPGKWTILDLMYEANAKKYGNSTKNVMFRHTYE